MARWRAAGIFGEQLCHKARDLATAIADDMRHASNPEDLADGRVMLDTLALEVAGAGVSEVAGSLASTSSAAEVAP